MLKKYFLFIVFLLFLGMLNAQHPFADGSGTADNPYQLTTAEHLDSLRNYCGDPALHFRLMNDIDLTAYINTNYGTDGWHPIYGAFGASGGSHFQGKLYGGGHEITGFRINSIHHQSGFFAYLGQGAHIDSLGIIVAPGDSVYSGVNTGILAGLCRGATITNSYTKGKVSAEAWVGGLVGNFSDGTITSCYSEVEVIGSYHRVGGLVGLLRNSTVTKSYSTGTVTATNYNMVGGLIGECEGYSVVSSYSTADVKGAEAVGGLIGSNYGRVSYCYAWGKTEGNDMVGGLIGKQNASASAYRSSIYQCYSIGKTIGNSKKTGGFIGYNEITDSFLIRQCFYDILTSSQSSAIGEDLGAITGAIQGKPTIEMKQQATYTMWPFDYNWGIVDGCTYPFLEWQPISDTVITCKCGYKGSGTATDPYQIIDAKDLDCLRNFSGLGFKNYHFEITKDIELKSYIDTVYPGEGWNPIGKENGYFHAKLHGNNYVISGLWMRINDTSLYGITDFGLFSMVGEEGILDNMVLKNVDIDIKSGLDVGGIAGLNRGLIENCSVSGSLKGNRSVGGICGMNMSLIRNCTNESNVSGEHRVGGVTGCFHYSYMSEGNIKYCCNTGMIKGERLVGGISGDNTGIASKSSTYACYNLGNVIGDSVVGGIIGYNTAKISCCYNLGKISARKYVGGIAGWNRVFLIGDDAGVITFCYYDRETGGLANGIGKDDNNQETNIESMSNAEMQQILSYPNSCWSYNGTQWQINQSCIYPYFETQTELVGNCVSLELTLSYVPNEVCDSTVKTCNGKAIVTITEGVAPYTIEWDDSRKQTTDTAVNLCGGRYCVTVKDANNLVVTKCIDVTDTVAVTFSVDAIVKDFCVGDTLSFNVTPISTASPFTYLWQGPGNYTSTTQNLQILNADTTNVGEYYITVSDANGCAKKDTVTAKLSNSIKLQILGQTSYCEKDNVTLYLNNYANISTIQWQLPDKNVIIADTLVIKNNTYADTGQYIADAAFAGNCPIIADTVNVSITPLPSISLGPDITTCQDTILTVHNTTYLYLWSTGETTQTISVNTTGDYWVKVTENGCSAADTIHVEVNNIPSVQITQSGSLCENQTTELIANTTASSILWSTGETSAQIEISQPGEYWVEASNAMCANRGIIKVQYTSTPVIQLVKDGDLCEGASTSITATTDAQSVVWNTGETTLQIQVDAPGHYWAEAANGDCISRDTADILVSAPPQLEILQKGDLCYTDNILLTAKTNVGDIVWSTGETTPQINVNHPGIYSVIVTDQNNCKNKKEVKIEKQTPSLSVEQIGDVCQNGTQYLTATTNADNLLWSTGHTQETIIIESSGEYSVTASTGNCTVSEAIQIYCDCELIFPNAFNPEGVLNTTFRPAENSQIISFKMYIYDRWGKMIFETHSMSESWNGKIDGKMAPQGGYVYLAYYLCKGFNVYKEKHGSFLLVR